MLGAYGWAFVKALGLIGGHRQGDINVHPETFV